jgi:hypothetical protein
MTAIDTLFADYRRGGRKAFIPFLPASDPDLAFTAEALAAVAGAGASLIEVGFPFSDPIADGPVIQASYTRALDRGLKLTDLFATLKKVTATPVWNTPLVGIECGVVRSGRPRSSRGRGERPEPALPRQRAVTNSPRRPDHVARAGGEDRPGV